MNRVRELVCRLASSLILAFHPQAHAENIDPTSLSIEQLMESQVTSVSRTEQKFSDTAAAVYIVTQDDIQRSGVTNIPDVLRMVPGIQVARINANEWAVTARGFNGRFANKLLVLLDGRTVYSPTFSGVRWENLDLILEDIERIEVIRGPGASVWGQNAVNGVINIITKHSEDTQQGLVSVVAGNEELAILELRYGDQFGDAAQYRAYAKFLRRDEFVDLQGNDAKDDWTQGRGGFRVDWNSHDGDQWMIEGDGFVAETNDAYLLPTDDPFGPPRRNSEQNSGASVLTRWEHDISVASRTHSQFYYEYFNLNDPEFGSERRHTFDLDFQHDIAFSKSNYFNWGLGYRFVDDSIFAGNFATFDPTQKNLHLFSAFFQDKASFFADKLHLTFGTKVQYYTLSGWDYQPSLRLLWKFHPKHRIWTSVSRATRSPSRGETAIGLRPLPAPGAAPFSFVVEPSLGLDAERVLSYELGYRAWLGNRFSLDIAFFFNDYDDLITGTSGPLDFTTGQIPAFLLNGASAKTWGIEAAADWRPIDPLRLQISYSFLHVNYNDPFSPSQEKRPRTDPANQLSFRSSYDITPSVAFDTWVRYVDSFTALGTLFSQQRHVDSYVGLDLRVAWKPISNLELSIVGQNVNNKAHLEYVEEIFAYPRQLERSVYGKIQWYFK